MKTKTILTAVLLAFVLASIGFLFVKETLRKPETRVTPGQAVPPNPPAPATDSPTGLHPLPPAHQVIAYYFHGTARCSNCLKIEAYTQEAIQSGFAEELKNGSLAWQVINVEEPGNQHFVQDYQLYTKSVILSDVHRGREVRWKNLDQVWSFLPDPTAFKNYVIAETKSYLVKEP